MKALLICLAIAATPATTLEVKVSADVVPLGAHTGIVWFHAAWCKPCRAMEPKIKAIEARGVAVRIVDVDREPTIADAYGVRSLPTTLYVVRGLESARVIGNVDAARIDRLLPAATAK